MKKVFSTLLFFLSFISFSLAQGTIDAVAISKTYYNSIVKILLYDSVMAKKNPAKAYIGRGSGFIVTDNGYIFTNRHVINRCTNGYYRFTTYDPTSKTDLEGEDVYTPSVLKDASIKKITYTGRTAAIVQIYDNENGSSYKLYYAKVVAVDTQNFDGAIIKIVSDLNGHPIGDDVKFHTVPLGNSDSITQGQDICLYGFPAQYNGTFDEMLKDLSTLTFGKHAGLDFFQSPEYGFIKTDAVINAGNSGGPAFGPGNKVIGLATAAFDKTNTGLIGGIDAMYDLAAQVPGLQPTLAMKGLSPAKKRPAQLTGSVYKPAPLPTKAMIRKANNSASKSSVVTNFMLIDLMLKAGFGGNVTCNVPSETTNSGKFNCLPGSYSVPVQFDGGPAFRLMFPSIVRAGNNLFGLLLSGSFQTITFSYQSLPLTYTDTANNVFQAHMYKDKPLNVVYLSANVGISYTYVFGLKASLSLFFSMGLHTDESRQIGEMDINYPPSSKQSTLPSVSYIMQQHGSSGFNNQTIGLIFRFKHLMLGAEYSMTKDENISFTCNLPNSTPINATLANRNFFSFSLGIAIRPKGKSE